MIQMIPVVGTCPACTEHATSVTRLAGASVYYPCGCSVPDELPAMPIPAGAWPTVTMIAEAAMRHDLPSYDWNRSDDQVTEGLDPYATARLLAQRRTYRSGYYGNADRWLRHFLRALGHTDESVHCAEGHLDEVGWCRHPTFRHHTRMA